MDFGPEFFEWVNEHINDNPAQLRLKYSGKQAEMPWLPIAIGHIASLRKASRKLNADIAMMPSILYPELALEQCSSAATAILHSHILAKRADGHALSVLDMTCGLGIDAMSFARAGFRVTAIELNREQAEIARYNFRNYPNVEIINADCEEIIKRHGIHYDAVFIDPARRGREGRRTYGLADCTPNLIDLMPYIRQQCDFMLAKLSPMLDVTALLKSLPGIERLHIVGTEGECKELLAEMDFAGGTTMNFDDVPIIVNDLDYPHSTFQFTVKNERRLQGLPSPAVPEVGDYVLIPSAALMKSNAFNSIAAQWHINPISSSSHIYVAKNGVEGFMGKQYSVSEVYSWSAAQVKSLAKMGIEADVTSKNFPLVAAEISKRLKLKPSNAQRLIATTTANGQKILILAKPATFL